MKQRHETHVLLGETARLKATLAETAKAAEINAEPGAAKDPAAMLVPSSSDSA